LVWSTARKHIEIRQRVQEEYADRFETNPISGKEVSAVAKMIVYSLHIFDRAGVTLYHNDFEPKKKKVKDQAEEDKLIYGLLFSLQKDFCQKMALSEGSEGFQSFRTNAYRLHYYESLTGIKFVLMTDAAAPLMRETLRYIYSNIYVEMAVKNPIFEHNRSLMDYDKFTAEVKKYLSKQR